MRHNNGNTYSTQYTSTVHFRQLYALCNSSKITFSYAIVRTGMYIVSMKAISNAIVVNAIVCCNAIVRCNATVRCV